MLPVAVFNQKLALLSIPALRRIPPTPSKSSGQASQKMQRRSIFSQDCWPKMGQARREKRIICWLEVPIPNSGLISISVKTEE